MWWEDPWPGGEKVILAQLTSKSLCDLGVPHPFWFASGTRRAALPWPVRRCPSQTHQAWCGSRIAFSMRLGPPEGKMSHH